MRTEVEWPDDLRLAGLIELPRKAGWRAYVQDPDGTFLQGDVGDTAQAAIDGAVARYRRSRTIEAEHRPQLDLSLDFLSEL